MPRTTIVKKCIRCGEEFRRTPADLRKSEGKYCSHRCAAIGRTRVNKIQVTCACGKIFFVYPSRYELGFGKHCSYECAFKNKPLKPRTLCFCNRLFLTKSIVINQGLCYKTCPSCKKLLLTVNFGIARNERTGLNTYCKPCCKEKIANHSLLRRRWLPNTPFTMRQLEQKLDYWGYKCYLCNQKINKKDLNVDHVKPLKEGGLHMLANLRPTHAICNKRKGAKWLGVNKLQEILN